MHIILVIIIGLFYSGCKLIPVLYTTGCVEEKVIELWSALASLLYNQQKSFFHSRKDQAFSFRMSPFSWNLKKDWANTNQMKIT